MERQKVITVISNITLEPFMCNSIKSEISPSGDNFSLCFVDLNDFKNDDNKLLFSNSDMIVIWLNIENLAPDIFNEILISPLPTKTIEQLIDLCYEIFKYISAFTYSKILWLLFEYYSNYLSKVSGHTYNSTIGELNNKLMKRMGPNVTFIDLMYLISEIGISNAYDTKNKYRWNMPYSRELLEIVTHEIRKQFLIEQGITRKCLVLDCDNVLWGGILNEDGCQNIKLSSFGVGRRYKDFQRFLLSLYYRGIILAVCSKNDLSDVLDVFKNHKEMVLKEKHIACFQVNWNDKPSNVRIIAQKLNIELESIVFVDDSDIEINAIKVFLPEVCTIRYDKHMTPDQITFFNKKSITNSTEIDKRMQTYKTNEFREQMRLQYDNYSDYLKQLNIKIEIHRASFAEGCRIAELTQRTNKCTNGRRYTEKEIMNRLKVNNSIFYAIYVSDCFSDLGLVGSVEIENNTLNLFTLSCRALGREVEQSIINHILHNHKIEKVIFISTIKNDNLKQLLKNYFPSAIFDTATQRI